MTNEIKEEFIAAQENGEVIAEATQAEENMDVEKESDDKMDIDETTVNGDNEDEKRNSEVLNKPEMERKIVKKYIIVAFLETTCDCFPRTLIQMLKIYPRMNCLLFKLLKYLKLRRFLTKNFLAQKEPNFLQTQRYVFIKKCVCNNTFVTDGLRLSYYNTFHSCIRYECIRLCQKTSCQQ